METSCEAFVETNIASQINHDHNYWVIIWKSVCKRIIEHRMTDTWLKVKVFKTINWLTNTLKCWNWLFESFRQKLVVCCNAFIQLYGKNSHYKYLNTLLLGGVLFDQFLVIIVINMQTSLIYLFKFLEFSMPKKILKSLFPEMTFPLMFGHLAIVLCLFP